MKAKQENEAEIALDVRSATRARAEAEHENQLAERKEFVKRELEKRKIRRERLSSFYYKVSLLFLTGSGISGFSPGLPQIDWLKIGVGVSSALIFALLAHYNLKY